MRLGPAESDPEEARDGRAVDQRIEIGNLLIGERRPVRAQRLCLFFGSAWEEDVRLQGAVEPHFQPAADALVGHCVSIVGWLELPRLRCGRLVEGQLFGGARARSRIFFERPFN